MALYARSDMMSVSIPVTSGGCGATHTRPVTRGAPVRTWKLECDKGCETYLRGDKKQKIIRTIPGDKDRGIPSRLEHISDSDPHWSNTPEGIPLTPDEQHVHKIRAEQGQQQLDQLSAYAALLQAGVNVPEQAQWLINRTLEEMAKPVIKGSVVCANGHDNRAGVKFCGECGVSLATQGALSAGEIKDLYEEPAAIEKLHVATLKKMCREKGLPDRGTRAELIKRLTVPATIKLGSTVGFDAGDGNF